MLCLWRWCSATGGTGPIVWIGVRWLDETIICEHRRGWEHSDQKWSVLVGYIQWPTWDESHLLEKTSHISYQDAIVTDRKPWAAAEWWQAEVWLCPPCLISDKTHAERQNQSSLHWHNKRISNQIGGLKETSESKAILAYYCLDMCFLIQTFYTIAMFGTHSMKLDINMVHGQWIIWNNLKKFFKHAITYLLTEQKAEKTVQVSSVTFSFIWLNSICYEITCNSWGQS